MCKPKIDGELHWCITSPPISREGRRFDPVNSHKDLTAMWGFIVLILVRMYKVYILFSVMKDRYYVGYAGGELMERMRKHNSSNEVFSRNTGDGKLVYHEL